MRESCVLAVTRGAKKRGHDVGTKFRADLRIVQDGGAGEVRARAVPFGSKKLTNKGIKYTFYQPASHRRSDLGAAQSFSISETDYGELCTKKTLTLSRPKSHYKITLTLASDLPGRPGMLR